MIKIVNIDEVVKCMEAVSACVPACKIEIGSYGLRVFAKNEISRIKLICPVEVVFSTVDISFCINEMSKFISLLRTVQKYQAPNEAIEMEFTGSFLTYKGSRTSFKFGTIKEDIIARFLDAQIKASLEPIAEFSVTQAALKELASSRSIISDSQTLRYIFAEDEVKKKMVFCSIKDTENPLTSEIRIHVSNSNESFSNRMILNHDRVLLMRCMPSVETCKIQCTNIGVVIISISTPANSAITILTASLKS